MLRDCPTCGEEIARAARVCPHCGAPLRQMTSNLPAAFIVLTLLAFGLLAMCSPH
jgi:predicted amidophosphoribosyltransferase